LTSNKNSPQNTRILGWFTFARSGSNYLSDIVASIKPIESFREIFQPGGVHLYNKSFSKKDYMRVYAVLSAAYGGDQNNLRNERLIEAVQTNPARLLDTFQMSELYAKDTIFSMKIFENHLSADRDLVSRILLEIPSSVCLAYTREPLDTYISAVKVQHTKSAISLDTTNVQPHLKLKNFRNWRNRRQKWIDFINKNRQHFSGLVRYEDLLLLGDTDRQIAALTKALAPLFPDREVEVMRRQADKIVTTSRQDWSQDPSDKVANFEAFLSECAKEDINPYVDERKLELPNLL
jgi:hypothetical protein